MRNLLLQSEIRYENNTTIEDLKCKAIITPGGPLTVMKELVELSILVR